MSLVNLLNKTVDIYRLVAVSGDKTAFSTITLDEPAKIDMLDGQESVDSQGAPAQVFKAYLEVGVDIQNGDIIKDNNGVKYKVLAGAVYKMDMGISQHIEIMVQKIE